MGQTVISLMRLGLNTMGVCYLGVLFGTVLGFRETGGYGRIVLLI